MDHRANRLFIVLTVGLAAACVSIAPVAGPSSSPGSPGPSGSLLVPASAGLATPEVTPLVTLEPQKTRKPRPSITVPPPTATPTTEPTPTPTVEITATPTPVPSLNYSLPAVYGSTALASGFVPDPYTVGVTAGGPANTNYLGGGCYGYATAAPTFSVNYTSGSASLLRLYFVGSGDTTMLINTPGADFVCVDDSFGTTNPTIDFNSPSSGRYDVWVATYSEGASIDGTLYVTELSSNHP